ncbi:MAG: sulfur carrier protein ThiS [Brevinematales bacterium]|nr:sulfur carrier protein ThiS [Brevinematales bacterium]
MKVTINGQKTEVNLENLKEILEKLGYNIHSYVVVLNGEIVPKSKIPELTIKEGDDIEILTIMGGG